MKVLLVFCLAATVGYAGACGAAEIKLDVDYVSSYVWRGLVLDSDPALQPSLTFAHPSGVSLNTWASVSLDGSEIDEVDYALSHTVPAGAGSFAAGVIAYTFPETGAASTGEVFASLTGGNSLSPSLTVYYDFDEGDGLYATVSVGRSFTAGPRSAYACCYSAKLGLGSSGYNRSYFSHSSAGVVDLVLSAAVTWPLGQAWSLSPSISLSTLLDGSLRDSVDDPDNFVVGLRLSTRL